MYNFANLDATEFEYLCKDVMSRKLNKEFKRFAAGRDKGIDSLYMDDQEKIIVQVKCYTKSSFSSLKRSLKEELRKIEKENPSEYYVCCSKELTADNKEEIKDIFSKYMKSIDNVIDLIDINDFLDIEENKDILKRHYKLWLGSTNILENMLSNDISMDTKVLIKDIKDKANMLVETSIYHQAIECLERNNVLIIIGDLGIGKTTTSFMVILNYIMQDYKLKYSTDCMNLSDLKKAISQSSNEKEIIYLDDCFGQAYFKMKESQENELVQLIKYVQLCPQKKLLLNSRITIYQEAKINTSLLQIEEKNDYEVLTLNSSKLTINDRSLILYNHLTFSEIPQEYKNEIYKDKRYLKIIQHKNFNPRIIEFVTNKNRSENITVEQYYSFVLNSLDNPKEVWEQEYSKNLKKEDRILLTTLYSLTNTSISLDIVQKCFNARINELSNIDTSLDYFSDSLNRLNGSMIKVVNYNHRKYLSVLNPSINDFLEAKLNNLPNERKSILETALSINQFAKLLSKEEFENKLKTIIKDHTIDNYLFENEDQKSDYIVYGCLVFQIYDLYYKDYIVSYVLGMYIIDLGTYDTIIFPFFDEIIDLIFNEEFMDFYQLKDIINNGGNLNKIIISLYFNLGLDLDEITTFISEINQFLDNKKELAFYIQDALEYIIKYQYSEIDSPEELLFRHLIGVEVKNADELNQALIYALKEEIKYYLSCLPDEFKMDLNFVDDLEMHVMIAEDLVKDYVGDNHIYSIKGYSRTLMQSANKEKLKIQELFDNSGFDE